MIQSLVGGIGTGLIMSLLQVDYALLAIYFLLVITIRVLAQLARTSPTRSRRWTVVRTTSWSSRSARWSCSPGSGA